jgi:hypothetical protein
MSNVIQLFTKKNQKLVWVFSEGLVATGMPREYCVKRNVAEVLLEYTENALGCDESEMEIWIRARKFLTKHEFSNMELKEHWSIRDKKTFPDCWDRLTDSEKHDICGALEWFNPDRFTEQ